MNRTRWASSSNEIALVLALTVTATVWVYLAPPDPWMAFAGILGLVLALLVLFRVARP